MPYAEYQPEPDLEPFVESVWLQQSAQHAAREPFAPTRALPTGSVDVAFYYRDPFFQVHATGREVLPQVTVTGPQTQFRLYGAVGRTGIILVRFRPGMASSFLRCSLHELRDANVDLGLIVGPATVREIEARLLEASTDASRAELVQQFVRCNIEPSASALVNDAMRFVAASGGRENVRGLSRRLQSSPRQLERAFRQFVGLTPKTFARIMRFQRALQHRRAGGNWAAVAHGCGYHDQAHLCNEFVSLAGITPEALLNRSASTPLARYFNRFHGGSCQAQTIYA
jgi:methylphosphotriester-DNA--protein-cysteine methyltransferase